MAKILSKIIRIAAAGIAALSMYSCSVRTDYGTLQVEDAAIDKHEYSESYTYEGHSQNEDIRASETIKDTNYEKTPFTTNYNRFQNNLKKADLPKKALFHLEDIFSSELAGTKDTEQSPDIIDVIEQQDGISDADINDGLSEDSIPNVCDSFNFYVNPYYSTIDGKCCNAGTNGGLICIVEAFDLAAPGPYGLTHCLGYLWISDYIVDAIYKLSETGEILGTFASPGLHTKGLACDGEFIWNVDSETLKAYKLKLNEDTLEAVYAVDLLKVTDPKGLTFLDGYLFCTNSVYDIHKVNPETGDTVGGIGSDLTPDSPVGLANDGKNLYVVNNYWNSPNLITIMTPTKELINSFNCPTSPPADITWDGQYLWLVKADSPYDNTKKLLKLEITQ